MFLDLFDRELSSAHSCSRKRSCEAKTWFSFMKYVPGRILMTQRTSPQQLECKPWLSHGCETLKGYRWGPAVTILGTSEFVQECWSLGSGTDCVRGQAGQAFKFQASASGLVGVLSLVVEYYAWTNSFTDLFVHCFCWRYWHIQDWRPMIG